MSLYLSRLSSFNFNADTIVDPLLCIFNNCKLCILNRFNKPIYLLNIDNKVYMYGLYIYGLGTSCSKTYIPAIEFVPNSTEYNIRCISLQNMYSPQLEILPFEEFIEFKKLYYKEETRNLIQMFINYLVLNNYFLI